MKLTPDLKKLFILTFLFAVFAPFLRLLAILKSKKKAQPERCSC